MTSIQVQGLTKRFGDVVAVDDLTFEVEQGSVTGFLGPNGAGKTTTLRMLLGLATPTAGTATIGGQCYGELVDPIRHVGAVLESNVFYPGRRARDHLRILCVAAGLPQARADEVLEQVGLTDAGSRRVKGFSLGMRQRLGLAAALLGDPEVRLVTQSSLRNMVHAELLKLRTTRMFYGNALLALAFVPITLAVAIQTAGTDGGPPSLETSEGLRNVLSAASSGTIVVLIIGILVMAGEFRHNTATSTFLVSPDRKRVVGAKLIASTVVGAGIAVAASVLTLAVALPWLAAKNIDVSLLSADVGLVLLGALAATALYALVGVGLGSLVRNQTAAVVVAMVWVMIVEGLLVSFVPEVGRWLPGGAVAALTSTATADGGLLPMWGGALLFAGYGLAFAAAGIRFVMRRDVA